MHACVYLYLPIHVWIYMCTVLVFLQVRETKNLKTFENFLLWMHTFFLLFTEVVFIREFWGGLWEFMCLSLHLICIITFLKIRLKKHVLQENLMWEKLDNLLGACPGCFKTQNLCLHWRRFVWPVSVLNQCGNAIRGPDWVCSLVLVLFYVALLTCCEYVTAQVQISELWRKICLTSTN